MLLSFLSPALPVFAAPTTLLEPGKFHESAVCGDCHEEIHAMWERSMHSAALSDPVFQASYMRAYLETGGEAKRICLRCHAPLAVLNDDLELRQPISREGITCDFCHSIVAVDLNRDPPFTVARDGVKRGPLGDARSPAHEVAKSDLHESADFCASCHEYSNSHGTPVLSTYSEWMASPQAAKGRTCQGCHMPLTEGATVRAGLGATSRRSINLHNISGMHSVEQVRKAATARILAVRRAEKRPGLAIVEVEVANVGSGHSIPTGLPTRKLVLEVVLSSDGQEVKRFTREYQKRLLDEQGRLITEDHDTILSARRVLDDNRLLAGERRNERFSAPVPEKGHLTAELRLHYVYEPKIVRRERISIKLATDSSR